MGAHYFPNNDLELRDWLANFASVLALNASAVGLQPADVTPIANAYG